MHLYDQPAEAVAGGQINHGTAYVYLFVYFKPLFIYTCCVKQEKPLESSEVELLIQ